MNLIEDAWIKVRRESGATALIAPWQITETDNPPVDIISPRPDFRAALYQFLIGLLQTTTECDRDAHWRSAYKNRPSPEELKAQFCKVADAFNLDGAGARFMQDESLRDLDSRPIHELFIDAATGKTLRDNTDHFVKRGGIKQLDLAQAATALFCLQTNAPSGGAGYRTGLRGGGPLTTLVLPADAKANLWQKLWLNVLPRSEFLAGTGNPQKLQAADRFPWMAATRVSDKDGVATYPEDAHPDQMYWSMPRRLWLEFSADAQQGKQCSVSGEEAELITTAYKATNYGVNYEGVWLHPLTPHSKNKDGLWLPRHPQPGGISYRYWLALTSSGAEQLAATVVSSLSQRGLQAGFRLWAFGYDMDNMKARGWQELQMPLYAVEAAVQDAVEHSVKQLIEAAQLAGSFLRSAVKEAWFSPGASVSGNLAFITDEYWQATEPAFYALLDELVNLLKNSQEHDATRDIQSRWFKELFNQAVELFDRHATSGGVDVTSMQRIAKAQNKLRKNLYGPKLRSKTLDLPPLDKPKTLNTQEVIA